MLEVYDVLATTYPIKSLPRRIGIFLDQFKGEYGASPTAIEIHVRRLLRERDARRLKLQDGNQVAGRYGLINRPPA